MAKYQMYFDTVQGEVRYNVDIDEDEALTDVLEEILYELGEHGQLLRDGEPQVIWNGQLLEFEKSLPQQGVHANEVLRVSAVSLNG